MDPKNPSHIAWAYHFPEQRKTADWYWALGLLGVAIAVAAVLLGNLLFALVVVLSMFALGFAANHPEHEKEYSISNKGITIGEEFYSFQSLESYYLDHEDSSQTFLRLKSEHFLVPLISFPVPQEYVDDIARIMRVRLKEEHLEEPLGHKILERLGF